MARLSHSDATWNDTTMEDDKGSKQVRKHSQISSGSPVDFPIGSSQKPPTRGQLKLLNSAEPADAASQEADAGQSLKQVSNSSPAPSTNREAPTLSQKVKAIGLTPQRKESIFPWQRTGKGRPRKVKLTIKSKYKLKRVTKGHCQQLSVFSRNKKFREEVENNLSKDSMWRFSFNPAYGSKNDALLNTSLSQKYQPKLFQDIAGHEIIVKVISNAVQKKTIACLYLFHGASGTGKTSTARILAMALSCESPTSRPEPCWSCRGCSRSLFIMELCSTNGIAGFEKTKTLLQSTSSAQVMPDLKVFIIEECHTFTAEAWDELLAIVEGPYGSTVVFILVTVDATKVPRNISSRCQKFGFTKLNKKDITLKLARILNDEHIRIEGEALRMIIAKAEGSLREAENILDQLVLLESTIRASMVQQLVGIVPRNKLINLIATIVSGDTMTTIKLMKELITSVEPHALVSQLTALIVDVLSNSVVADSSGSVRSSKTKIPLRSRSELTKTQSTRLCYVLRILVETEKQLRSTADQTSVVLATLLEITSADICDGVSTGIKPSGDKPNAESGCLQWQSLSLSRSSIEPPSTNRTSDLFDEDITESSTTVGSIHKTGRHGRKDRKPSLAHMTDMENIWQDMVERIQCKDMQEFLRHQVKLASLSVSRDKMVAQKSEKSISKALKSVIGCPVTMNMSLEPVSLGTMEEYAISTNRTPIFAEYVHGRDVAALNTAQDISSSSEKSTPRQNRYPSKGKERTMVLAPQISPLIGLGTGPNRSELSADSERDNLARQRTLNSIDTAHAIEANKPKHRWVSLSSIPQSDASVEPYSQDILLENKNAASKVRNNSKFQKCF